MKKYINILLKSENVLLLRKAARYFGCTNSEMLGLLLANCDIKNDKISIAGEPAATRFKKFLLHGDDNFERILTTTDDDENEELQEKTRGWS